MSNQNQPDQDFSGATFTGAMNFGSGGSAHVDKVINYGGTRNDSAEQLCELIAELVTTLNNQTDDSAELQEARWRAEELAEELDAKKPDADKVKKRWLRLEPLVPAFTAAGSVATITNLVNELL